MRICWYVCYWHYSQHIILKYCWANKTDHTLPHQQPRWEAFSTAQASNETHTLEAFELQRVQLPPSPFFEQKLLPILNNNSSTLMRLQLSGCDLDFEGFKSYCSTSQEEQSDAFS